jgi:hypothetical protein
MGAHYVPYTCCVLYMGTVLGMGRVRYTGVCVRTIHKPLFPVWGWCQVYILYTSLCCRSSAFRHVDFTSSCCRLGTTGIIVICSMAGVVFCLYGVGEWGAARQIIFCMDDRATYKPNNNDRSKKRALLVTPDRQSPASAKVRPFNQIVRDEPKQRHLPIFITLNTS